MSVVAAMQAMTVSRDLVINEPPLLHREQTLEAMGVQMGRLRAEGRVLRTRATRST